MSKTKIFITISLFLILMSLFYSFNSNKDIKIINKGIYSVIYSQKYKNPINVTYKLYKPKHKIKRLNKNFYNESGVITASDLDFKFNRWDKGHMCPAANFNNTKENLNLTFSYINCAVQHKNLNRGVWKELEIKERELANNDSIKVIIDVIINNFSSTLKSGTYIPDKFRKTIILLTHNDTIIYEFPNSSCNESLNYYRTK